MSKAEALAQLRAAVAASATTRMREHRALLKAVETGASLAELSEEMGIPRQTVWHRINAARKALGIEK